jgi:hypothetical protein
VLAHAWLQGTLNVGKLGSVAQLTATPAVLSPKSQHPAMPPRVSTHECLMNFRMLTLTAQANSEMR